MPLPRVPAPHGQRVRVQARFSRENVQVSGQPRSFTRASDEGEDRTFYFCPNCGVTVYYQLSSAPEVIAIPVGTFADPAFPPPQVSVWESRKHPWVTVTSAKEHRQ